MNNFFFKYYSRTLAVQHVLVMAVPVLKLHVYTPMHCRNFKHARIQKIFLVGFGGGDPKFKYTKKGVN